MLLHSIVFISVAKTQVFHGLSIMSVVGKWGMGTGYTILSTSQFYLLSCSPNGFIVQKKSIKRGTGLYVAYSSVLSYWACSSVWFLELNQVVQEREEASFINNSITGEGWADFTRYVNCHHMWGTQGKGDIAIAWNVIALTLPEIGFQYLIESWWNFKHDMFPDMWHRWML